MVQQVHEDFIANGAEVITTNSYAVVPFHIGEQRFVVDGKILADLAGRLAKSAVQNSGKSVKIAVHCLHYLAHTALIYFNLSA
ncbi:Homocysteine S-methyltransferase [Avibacterium paragallinarum]|uniref:Homocysteine S-methyltransferase n=1 Tax=Avibacterium paragallinarum TaxID=728 RepID=A0A380X0U0_AVIPA|nr:Homocysteine S-methyltransferase [Avibacterium paragallinarum]